MQLAAIGFLALWLAWWSVAGVVVFTTLMW
jgi:hypothetical protein